MSRTTPSQGEKTISPTVEVSCRVDYRPAAAQEFCEWSVRVNRLSATGCSIQTAHHSESGAGLELRIYMPDSAWPIRVQKAEVIWSHWDEFTVEFREVSTCDQDQLEGCLMESSALVAAYRAFSLNKILQ